MEISSLVNEVVVSQHAEEAAFLWTLRNRAAREPHYSLRDLGNLDERVEAHLDGLRAAGDAGWTRCQMHLANTGPSAVFPLAVVAFSSADRERMLEALTAGCVSAMTQPALVSALGWIAYESVSPWILRLLEAKSSVHRAVGIAASAIHRQDPGPALVKAVDDADALLRARALRAAGELKRRDLETQLVRHLRDDDEACRFWAAWSLALQGEPIGLSSLCGYVERNDVTGRRALQVALRAMSLDEGRRRISSLVQEPGLLRVAVMGTGILGDPTSVPWLIRKMDVPDLARVAGEAFTMITGANLSYHDLDQDPPSAAQSDGASIEEVLDLDYESNLPWPAATAISRWWEDNQHRFSLGTRYLAGEPITLQSLHNVLGSGTQRQRESAALELALIEEGQVLFEVRAPAERQQEQLGIATW